MKSHFSIFQIRRQKLRLDQNWKKSNAKNEYPCLLRPGNTKDIWVGGERMRAKRFVYRLCVGDLENGESVRQFCSPRGKKGRLKECLQAKHLYKPGNGVTKKKRKGR